MEVWRKAKVFSWNRLFWSGGPAAISPEFRPFSALGPCQRGGRYLNVRRVGLSDLGHRGSPPQPRLGESLRTRRCACVSWPLFLWESLVSLQYGRRIRPPIV